MSQVVIQRIIFPAELRVAPLYYSHVPVAASPPEDPTPVGRRSIRIEPGTALSTGTYFNSFFEAHWRRFTRLGRLVLRLAFSGRGTVRLYRRTAETGITLLETAAFDRDECELRLEPAGSRFHHRELGTLYFDVIARTEPVTLHRAEWVALDVEPAPVGLVAGYCTFHREPYLLDNVHRLCADREAAACLRRVVIVDQGTRRVTAHPAFAGLPRDARAFLHVVEQGNFGGAGGFTRAVLEALGTEGATHVLLMDDDATLEPESVFRTAAFLALAREDLAVGGSMLDMLRPTELFEQTAEVYPHVLAPGRVLGGMRVDGWRELEPLLEIHTTRYNGWWFLALPLAAVRRLGLPLPFFIRGDDIEFGCRLNRAGLPTVPLPGVAVWHEPFYLKCRGWQNYYELRNVLALCALHFPLSRRQVVAAFFRRLVHRLLTHDYAEAWMMCEAVDDYCRGPVVLADAPQARHQRLLAGHRELAEPPVPAARHLPTVDVPPLPRSRLRRRLRQARLLLRQCLRASPPRGAAPGYAVRDRGDAWWYLGLTDVVAVRDPYAADLPVLRRSRVRFLRLLARGTRTALRLWWRQPGVVRRWQAASGRLTSPEFWQRYLGLGAVQDGEGEPALPPVERQTSRGRVGDVVGQAATAAVRTAA